MRFAGITDNDIVDGIDGISVSFWTQGCPFHCHGCHNPETWDFNGGKELPDYYLDSLIEKLTANGIQRNLSILGGEPLCPENEGLIYSICRVVKQDLPNIKIILWTGYTMEQLKKRAKTNDPFIGSLLKNYLDVIIDGPYKQELRDLRLKLRGSSNQRIWKRIKYKLPLLHKNDYHWVSIKEENI